MKDPGWGVEFQRLVLACALGGDLLALLPSALRPELFGSQAKSTARSPRERLAGVVAEYWVKYGARPSRTIFAELVRAAAGRLGDAERDEVMREAERVAAWPVPDDPAFVVDEVRAWAEYKAAAQGLVRAADLLDAGPSALPAIRALLAKATEPIVATDRQTSVAYLEERQARLALWQSGAESGQRIPTGFADLDRVLRGGPTRREVWYFIAPPKGGKTAALLSVARNAARRRFGVYVVTYEMQALRMALRLDRMFARRSKEELRDDLENLKRALAGLVLSGAGEIFIDERPSQQPTSVQQAARRVAQLRREGRTIDLVVFDYLNIMGASRDEREKRHELSRTSRDMSGFAKAEDVLVWSAALVKRAALNKRVVRKDDIAEAYEVISVMDGGVAICGTREMLANGYRRFHVVAAREEADEVSGGDYVVDFDRMSIDQAEAGAVDAVLPREGIGE